ncbi:putative cysteine-rich protein YhjQ [Planktothrix tepida]|uniref:Uncharacterized cysteine-rich protein YhjQ n=2 Tax=Planktothrix TaxID=54304 RepID=A0A1J1LL48_9CYAN
MFISIGQLCWTIAGFMSRGSRFIAPLCRTCLEICEACAKECQKHNNTHCQSCATACQNAAEEYRKIAMVGAAI